jgi:hypothetical protein
MAQVFVDEHHSYIKWVDRPSRKLYWLLYEEDRLVGVWGLASAFDRPKSIQEYMKKYGISFNELGNNIVYCLHGHTDKNAGTKFLKLLRIDARRWWMERYEDKLKAVQSFILPPRTGAMYKADNWEVLGMTAGAGQKQRTLYGKDRDEIQEGVEIRTFKSGEVKYLLRERETVPKKLILIRRL